MIDPIELYIGGSLVEVEPKDGEMIDGVFHVDSISIEFPEAQRVYFDESVEWQEDGEEDLKEVILSELFEVEEVVWPDTLKNDWSDETRVSPDTTVYTFLDYVSRNFPTTTEYVVENTDMEKVEHVPTGKAKDRKLIRSIGRSGKFHILSPTHVGIKEILEHTEGGDYEHEGADVKDAPCYGGGIFGESNNEGGELIDFTSSSKLKRGYDE